MKNNFTPLISIIIPTYNHAKFIGKAIKSLIYQKYQNWEAIVIDNYSTDQTLNELKNYSDPRIKYFQINNGGVIAKSRNYGIHISQGDWIAFLDSDDWWTQDKLEVCVDNINEDVDFIYHDLETINNKPNSFFNKNIRKGRKLKKPILSDLLVSTIKYGNAIGNSSVMVRKNILSKIGKISEDLNLVGSEDYNTWLRIAEITDNFKYLNKVLGYILIHETNVSKKDMSIPQREAVQKFMDKFDKSQKLKLEVKFRYISGTHNYLKNNYIKAKEDFIFVIKNGEFNLKIRSLIKIFINILKYKNAKI